MNNFNYSTLMMATTGDLLEVCLHGSVESVARKQIGRLLEKTFYALVREISPKVSIEIGAHQGYFSSRIKKLAPDMRVVAFEANPEVYNLFKEKLFADGVEFINKAVAEHDARMKFSVPKGTGEKKGLTMGSLLSRAAKTPTETIDIEAVNLDRWLGSDVSRRNVMWIDVEGAIGLVLPGCKAALSVCDILIIELEQKKFWPEQMLDHDVIQSFADYGLVPVLRDVQRQGWQYNAIFLQNSLLERPIITDLVKSFYEEVEVVLKAV